VVSGGVVSESLGACSEMGLSSLDTSTDFAVEKLRFWWGCLRIVAERE